jgi:glycosyltransferase involved in cell wall biosynthesis/GT2 family glycosyltransferase
MPDSVAVIVPVYGAAPDLDRCLASVALQTDLTRHRLLIVVDGPQGEDVEAVLRRFACGDVIRNARRMGFAASVNRGMAATSSDVVLLNSDTVVTPRWLEKMIDAAYAHGGDIGTVTPLSNHATLCSVPRAFEENLIPAGHDLESFARHVEAVSRREYPRLPTGVGFCLYIRRALLDDIGLFDAEAFMGGYGEENDFCMRALGRGWVHIADDATFVYHAGHRSFGASRRAREKRGLVSLMRRHPRYMATIAEFMRAEPLAGVRKRITAPLQARGSNAPAPLRITHLVHGWPPFQYGGTELYAGWLVEQQRGRHEVSVYARSSDASRGEREAVEWLDRGTRVRLVTNLFTTRDPLRRNAIRDRPLDRDFERFLRGERPDVLHIHHLAGHAFSLIHVARRLRIPIVMQLQDWWALCARVNRLDREGRRCSGPSLSKCARCATLTRLPPAPFTNRLMHALRNSAARSALRAADAFIAGSEAIRADYAGALLPSTPFHVIPYGVAISPPSIQRLPTRLPLRFGYVGAVAPHKGVHTAIEAVRHLDHATLHIWGDGSAFPAYTAELPATPNVVYEGPFREEDKSSVFSAFDVLIVPSIGLESFGLAAREAMACGVPVIATSGGALSEMFEPGSCGEFFPPGDAGALRAILERVVRDPTIVDAWRSRLPVPRSVSEHAAEVEGVYRSVLARFA